MKKYFLSSMTGDTIDQFPKRKRAHLELKETKNITYFLLLKTHPH